MIEYVSKDDVEEILTLCINTHPLREKFFLEHYFHHLFDGDYSYVMREDNKIVSCMQMREHPLYFYGKVLLCSYVFGVATHIDYRQRGFMDHLMQYTLDVCNQNYLISFIEAYNPKLYKKYGFETISYRKKFHVGAKELLVNNVVGVSEVINASDMATLYRTFAKHFDCYYMRDEAYYRNYLAAIDEMGKVIAYYENQVLKGYCVYYEQEDMVEVKEIIYMDSLTLYKLLKYAIGYMPYIGVEVSNNEHVERLFKHAIARTSTCVMARVNNYALFEKLYGVKIKHVNEAFDLLKKPILINEKY